MELNVVQTQMVEQFQCPGCVNGHDTKCGVFKPRDMGGSFQCESHVSGTALFGVQSPNINLGLPKGFCRTVIRRDGPATKIRLYDTPSAATFDKFNVPVWAMEEDGYLFVRTYSPRIDQSTVDVIRGGTLALVPGALNVADFLSEMD